MQLLRIKEHTRNLARQLALAGLMAAAVGLVIWPVTTEAGGPVVTGGGIARGTPPEGEPFIAATLPYIYTVDGGSLGTLDNATAKARVAAALARWTDVPTSAMEFIDGGPINATDVPDGDVDTLAEFITLLGAPGVLRDCGNPVIFDADGSLFQALGIGGTTAFSFGALCDFDETGRLSGAVTVNGAQFDGNTANGELPNALLDEIIMHEFGHGIGLNHTQVNVNCFTLTNCAPGSDDAFGYPTMTTGRVVAAGVLVEEAVGVPATISLAADDIAWVSMLYPETVDNGPTQVLFTSVYGVIEGQVLYSDGATGAQHVNIIARPLDDLGTPEDESRRNAISATSGRFFTAEPGNPIINPAGDIFGSRDPAFKGFFQIPVPAGTYRVEIEGHSQTPTARIFSSRIPDVWPVTAEFYDSSESDTDDPATVTDVVVAAGVTVPDIDIVMNGTAPRFDVFDAVARNEDHTTASIILSGQYRASISPFDAGAGDEDTYGFDAVAGTPVTIETIASRAPLSTPLDTVIEVLDGSGARLMTCRDPIEANGDVDFNGNPDATPSAFDDMCANDDIAPGPAATANIDSMLEFDPPTDGRFFVRVSDKRGDARPDFEYDLLLSGATAPVPGLTLLSTGKVDAGGSGFGLTVTGTEFVRNSTVRWGGADRVTTYTSPTQLAATIPASDISSGAGGVPVTVLNPAPGGGESGALLVDVADYALTATPASITVRPGQSATYTVSLAPLFSSFDTAVSLSCSGVPAETTCSVSPALVTPGGATTSATLTVLTSGKKGMVVPTGPGAGGPVPLLLILSVVLLLSLPWVVRRGAGLRYRSIRSIRVNRWTTALLVIVFAGLLGSCGGGPKTPKGTHSITITGQSGSLSHSTGVTLIVE